MLELAGRECKYTLMLSGDEYLHNGNQYPSNQEKYLYKMDEWMIVCLLILLKSVYHFLNNGYTDSLLANSQQACGWSGIEGEIWSNHLQQHSRVQYRGGLGVCWSNTRVGMESSCKWKIYHVKNTKCAYLYLSCCFRHGSVYFTRYFELVG